MPYTMTVSPDFPPTQIAGWYIFNTWLQKKLDISIHLELYNNFDEQRNAIEENKIDLIFANPFDASMLVREKGFSALVKPDSKSDEVIIAVSAESKVMEIEDLQAGIKIAKTDDPDVNMIGMIILEPADLDVQNTISEVVDTYAIVAKQLIQGNSDVGFFLKDAYENFSDLIAKNLRVLVSSQIDVISHAFMAGPKVQEHTQALQEALIDMANDPNEQKILESLGFTGWTIQDHEDTEFMIDLMETLVN